MTEALVMGAEAALAVGGFFVSLALMGFLGVGVLVALALGLDWWANKPPKRPR